ncbi:oligosaccharide flippase family protein [Streptomyces sp. ISL-90]|nr:oligosaccharide flippase family protein [Streptomyces sp. ISL-90]
MKRIVELLRRDSAYLITAANFIAIALSFATAPIVARAIGPDGRGETAAALAAFAVVPVIMALGLPLELRRRAATSQSDDAVRAARDLAGAALVPSIAIAALLVSTVFAPLDSLSKILVVVGVSLSPLVISWSSDTGTLVGRGRFRAVLILRITQPLIFFIGALAEWLSGSLTVPVVLGVNIAATIATAVIGALFVRVSLRGERASHTDLLRKSVRFAGSSVAEAASNRLDQVIALPLIGAFDAGLYSAAASIAALPLGLGHALGAAEFRAVAMHAAEGPAETVNRGIRSAISATLIACLGLAVVTPWLVPLLFGASFSGSIVPTLICLVGSLGLTVGYVASMMLAAQGRGSVMTVAQVTCLTVNIALLFALAPWLGAVGAAIASSAAFLVLLVILTIALRVRPQSLIPTATGVREAVRTLFR